MNPNEIEIHYFLPKGTHSADAFIIAKAESEFLALIKETASILDISFRLETEARTEGGIKQVWKAFGKNAGQIACLLAFISILMQLLPDSDRELIKLQKEEARLHIELLKEKLETPEQNIDSNLTESAASEINTDLRIVRRRSNFYQALEKEPKIESVSFTLLNEGEPTSEPKSIVRDNFYKYIALTGKLPTEIDDDAIIGIISPVLTKGRFKWKGVYKDQIIDFRIHDKHFRESVLRKEIDFHSGTSINCVLEMKIKVDEVGAVSTAGYYVTLVKEIFDDSSFLITDQGKAYAARKKFEKDQLDLI